MAAPTTDRTERYKAARRATVIAAGTNVLLSVGKILAGIYGNSAAILADGIHSASDLITDVAVMVGMRVAKQEADRDHPYGHGKFETLATQFISVVLLAVAFGICVDAVERLQEPALEAPTSIALLAAFVSLLSKEALFQYTIRLGKRLDAKALIANAWHQRSDAISSIAALVGIAGAMMGLPILDPLAAIAVALILAKVGIDLFRDAFQELTDSITAVDGQIRDNIKALIDRVPEVLSAHFLTPRRLGPDVVVDVHVVVDPLLSVSEGHQIAEKVRQLLVAEVNSVTDVMVHVDPVDDGDETMPLMTERGVLIKLAEEYVARNCAAAGLRKLTLHYTRSGIVADLLLEADGTVPMEDLKAEAESLCANFLGADPHLVEVRVNLSLVGRRAPAAPALELRPK